jgi:hypothetical protein
MAGSPTIVANMVLDAIGVDEQVGNIEEGSRVANVLLRAYGRCRQDLLRAAPWSFARKQTTMVLLADSSGQTANVGTVVPGTSFQYEYRYPADCLRIRYIPWNPFNNPPVPTTNITPSDGTSPPTTGSTGPQRLWQPIRPSLYQITNDPNYPLDSQADPTVNPGQSPTGSTVILSNVQSASIVYTFDAVYPMLWDNLFTSALVAYMASEVTLGLWSKNPKYGMGIRREQIAIAQKKLIEARIADGNASTVSTSHLPDWMRARASYGNNGFNNNGWGLDGGAGGAYGVWGNGYSGSLSFSDGSAY